MKEEIKKEFATEIDFFKANPAVSIISIALLASWVAITIGVLVMG